MEKSSTNLATGTEVQTTTKPSSPKGFLAPVTLPGKMMQQELCRWACAWDDALPLDVLKKWNGRLEDLDQFVAFNVAGCIKSVDFGEVVCAQLHHFADASEGGYGAVTYLKMLNQQCHIQISFLLGKFRVTPVKAIPIPRLEWQQQSLMCEWTLWRRIWISSWRILSSGWTAPLFWSILGMKITGLTHLWLTEFLPSERHQNHDSGEMSVPMTVQQMMHKGN